MEELKIFSVMGAPYGAGSDVALGRAPRLFEVTVIKRTARVAQHESPQ